LGGKVTVRDPKGRVSERFKTTTPKAFKFIRQETRLDTTRRKVRALERKPERKPLAEEIKKIGTVQELLLNKALERKPERIKKFYDSLSTSEKQILLKVGRKDAEWFKQRQKRFTRINNLLKKVQKGTPYQALPANFRKRSNQLLAIMATYADPVLFGKELGVGVAKAEILSRIKKNYPEMAQEVDKQFKEAIKESKVSMKQALKEPETYIVPFLPAITKTALATKPKPTEFIKKVKVKPKPFPAKLKALTELKTKALEFSRAERAKIQAGVKREPIIKKVKKKAIKKLREIKTNMPITTAKTPRFKEPPSRMPAPPPRIKTSLDKGRLSYEIVVEQTGRTTVKQLNKETGLVTVLKTINPRQALRQVPKTKSLQNLYKALLKVRTTTKLKAIAKNLLKSELLEKQMLAQKLSLFTAQQLKLTPAQIIKLRQIPKQKIALKQKQALEELTKLKLITKTKLIPKPKKKKRRLYFFLNSLIKYKKPFFKPAKKQPQVFKFTTTIRRPKKPMEELRLYTGAELR
jgi:hypothetical protein